MLFFGCVHRVHIPAVSPRRVRKFCTKSAFDNARVAQTDCADARDSSERRVSSLQADQSRQGSCARSLRFRGARFARRDRTPRRRDVFASTRTQASTSEKCKPAQRPAWLVYTVYTSKKASVSRLVYTMLGDSGPGLNGPIKKNVPGKPEGLPGAFSPSEVQVSLAAAQSRLCPKLRSLS